MAKSREDDKPFFQDLGRLVRKAREQAGYTQDQLAEAVGLTKAFFSFVEAGERKLSIPQLYRIETALGVEPFSLFPGRPRTEAGGVQLTIFEGLDEPVAKSLRRIAEGELESE